MALPALTSFMLRLGPVRITQRAGLPLAPPIALTLKWISLTIFTERSINGRREEGAHWGVEVAGMVEHARRKKTQERSVGGSYFGRRGELDRE